MTNPGHDKSGGDRTANGKADVRAFPTMTRRFTGESAPAAERVGRLALALVTVTLLACAWAPNASAADVPRGRRAG